MLLNVYLISPYFDHSCSDITNSQITTIYCIVGIDIIWLMLIHYSVSPLPLNHVGIVFAVWKILNTLQTHNTLLPD